MKKAAYCSVPFSLILCLILPGVAGAEAEQVQSPVGFWESVDFVEHVEDFQPGKRATRIELFLIDIDFMPDGRTSSFVTWQDNQILHHDGKTKAQYYIKTIDDSTHLFLPWLSGDVTERGMKPWYYVLKKTSDTPRNTPDRRLGSFQTIRPVDSVSAFDDMRWRDLSSLRVSEVTRTIDTLRFNEKTVWPNPDRIPPAKKPDRLLKDAMNPGLGVRRLHQQGITGKGVNVAIIDQAMFIDHPEFDGKIVAYHDLVAGKKSSMHGPAVTSLLVGNSCGTAPDAGVYYVAARDGVYEVDYAEGLDWIVEQNTKLPGPEKIRVVSVSAAPGKAGTVSGSGQKRWDDACARAEAAGILVLDCTDHHGFISRCYLDAKSPDNVARCIPGSPKSSVFTTMPTRIYAPTCPRTTAEQYDKDQFSYQYCGTGGLSWAIPYAAGVLAMGWQVNPELSAEQMKSLLFESAYTQRNGAKIINPKRFILLVKKTKPATVKR